jgi:hypothetical protein
MVWKGESARTTNASASEVSVAMVVASVIERGEFAFLSAPIMTRPPIISVSGLPLSLVVSSARPVAPPPPSRLMTSMF